MKKTDCVDRIGIGIDTARYGHHASFLDDHKRPAAKSFHFTESNQGYRQFDHVVATLRRRHPQATISIRIDAAGQYATNLQNHLQKLYPEAVISVGQPTANGHYRALHFPKRKADPTESLACARYAIVEQPVDSPRLSLAMSTLRDAVSQAEAAATNTVRLINQLHNLLARTFPELGTLVPQLGTKAILRLLTKYPTAKRVAAARRSSLLSIPRLRPQLAEAIHEAAKTSVAAQQDALSEQLVRLKAEEVLVQQQRQEALESLIDQAVEQLGDGPHRQIRTIPGVGPQTAAALVAKIGSIKRFSSAKALIGYFGIFPEQTDVSGVHRDGSPKGGKASRMSRKGNDHVRRLLYTAAQTAVRFNPAVREVFKRQIGRGKAYNVAIGHCMAKLLRQVYAVWVSDTPFDPERGRSDQGEDLAVEKQENAAGHSQALKPSRKVVTATGSSLPPEAVSDQSIVRQEMEKTAALSVGDFHDTRRAELPSSEPAVGRSPCPSEASGRPIGRAQGKSNGAFFGEAGGSAPRTAPPGKCHENNS